MNSLLSIVFLFLLLLMGLFIMYIGGVLLSRYTKEKQREYTIVTGTVIDSIKADDLLSEVYEVTLTNARIPVFEYKYNGIMYQVKHNVTTTSLKKEPSKKFEIGAFVELRVFSDDPKTTILNNPASVKATLICSVVLFAAGISCVVFSLYPFIK